MNDRQQLNQSELIALLGQLKNKKAQYPAELQVARRAAFVAQIQAINLPSHGGGQQGGQGYGGQDASAGSQFMGAPAHAIETALQYVLAGLVAVMVGTAAYVYQDEIRDFINPPTPAIEMIDTAAPTLTPLNTATEIPSDTPTPTIAVSTPTPNKDDGQPIVPTPTLEPAPTQPPPTQPPPPTPTNPGLHLGQTKTPKP